MNDAKTIIKVSTGEIWPETKANLAHWKTNLGVKAH